MFALATREESVIQNEESDPFQLIEDHAFSDAQNVYLREKKLA